MEEKTTMTKEPAAKNHAHSLPAPAASLRATLAVFRIVRTESTYEGCDPPG